ncbi:histidine phosphatase family protein [Afipia sp. GAS231]|uniref:SixA phosphatase family protein n=1 Tax=Afipia sp. GAS231 TaxID=1882747 RepID=UPI00087AC71B|nr:histidine phosphatase family protein [Afipia sp. GAS231]SDN31415.1 phosphohistidine phosphatase [Afipia sp. GAS231]
MRRLMLLRHAKTEHDAPSGQDQDRRLDDRGRLDAAAIGTWIGRHPPLPGAVLVSTAVRARQTWEIAGQAIKDAHREQAASKWQVEFLDDIYGAEPARLLQIVRMTEVTDPRHLLVVGHNPGMHELALMLTGSGDAAAKQALQDNLPTAGLAILDFAIDDWSEVAFRGGKLVRFTSPRLLKQASDE